MGTDIQGVFQKHTPVKTEAWEILDTEYEFNRHYLLFGWLADVRNGFGFAGMITHVPITPLRGPRGLPADVAAEMSPDGMYRGVCLGDYSFGWLTSTEILNSVPDTSILRTGVLSREQFANWDGVSNPESWCGDVAGGGVKVAESPSEIEVDTTHVRVEWFVAPEDEFKYFIDEVRRLHDLHGEVRFVFGFDS
jgi:hypothetical protein